MKKQLISMLLVVVMVLGLMPVGAVAAAPGDTVYVTLSNKGTIATTADGAQVAQLAVTLPSGSHTVDQVLTALHEQFFADGLAGYSQTEGRITRLWGVEGGNYGFFCNHALGNLVTDTVEAGDTLDVAIYGQAAGQYDAYLFFKDSTLTAETGENITVDLRKLVDYEFGDTEPVSSAALTVNGTVTALTTDSDGKAVLNFSKAGTYIVTNTSTAYQFRTAAACVITVTGEDKVNAKLTEVISYRLTGSTNISKTPVIFSPAFSADQTEYEIQVPES